MYEVYPVPKADGLNQAETRERTQGVLGGGRPGKRKRGYHRALKRGESWARIESMMRSVCQSFISEMYNPNPLMSMTGLRESLKNLG